MKIIHNLPSSEYHSINVASSSNLKSLRQNELKFISNHLASFPWDTTDSMILGELVHCLTLTPSQVADEFVFIKEGVDRRTKDGKAFFESLGSDPRVKIKPAIADKAYEMSRMITASKRVSHILNDKDSLMELSAFWTDKVTGEECKCRWDCINPEMGIILDIKTTNGGIKHDDFAKTMVNFSYDHQAAFYVDAAKMAFDIDHFNFIFVVVDSNNPHDVALYCLDDNSIMIGRQMYQQNIIKYKKIMDQIRSGELTDLSQMIEDKLIETLSLPGWAKDLTRR